MAKQDKTTTTNQPEEDILVIEDEKGNNYIIPIKNLMRSIVLPTQDEGFRGSISGKSSTVGADFLKVVGVYKMTQSERRKYSPPMIIAVTPSEPTTS
jgi:hypothetical protein